MRRFRLAFFSIPFSLLLLIIPVHAGAACPDLSGYYPSDGVNWPILSRQLAPMLEDCLENAEYFALYGAAQLNSGNVAEATESLERALLLEPEYGAAQIDYAQALYLQGQLFSALELNKALLGREDLPPKLQTIIQSRQRSWQALTTERSAQLDVLAGYDSNLNGAPDPDQITLTLSGGPVLLDLSEEFRPQSGPYLNFRLGNRYRQLAPQHQHNWLTEVRGRVSEDTDSNLLQLDSRYSFIKPGRNQSWQVDAGVGYLQFGGSSLYTAADVRVRYQQPSQLKCTPYYGLALQQQFFHGQTDLNALESKASAGMICPIGNSRGPQQLGVEVSLLTNTANDVRRLDANQLPTSNDSGRVGGDRDGWQVNLDWRASLPIGDFRGQLSHTRFNDSDRYFRLVGGGVRRSLSRSYVLLQYRRPLRPDMTLLLNLYHQNQHSNLELFRSVDTTLEIGVSLAF